MTWSEIYLGIFFFVALVSLWFHTDLYTTKAWWLARYFPILILFATAHAFIAECSVGRSKLEYVLIVSATSLALITLAEAAGGFTFLCPRGPVATLGSRNFVAAYLAILFPILMPRIFCGQHPLRWGPIGIVVLAAIILTRSRAAWLVLIIQVVVGIGWLIRNRAQDKRAIAKAIGGAMMIGIFTIALVKIPHWSGLHWFEQSPYQASAKRIVDVAHGSGLYRLGDYAMSAEMVWENPWFGIGPGRWYKVAPQYTHLRGGHAVSGLFADTPSTDLVRFLSETGGLGAATLGAALFLFFWGIYRRESLPITVGEGTAALGIASALIIASVDVPFFRPETLVAVAILAALATSRTGTSPLRFSRRTLSVAGISVALFAFLVHATFFTSLLPLTQSQSLAAWRRAQKIFISDFRDWNIARLSSGNADDCRQAELEIARLIHNDPMNYLAHVFEARCQGLAGNRESAASSYQRALAIEPHDRAIQEELTTLLDNASAHWHNLIARRATRPPEVSFSSIIIQRTPQ
jgi:hypothetical protein